MREIKYIVIHCTATDQSATVENIKKYWAKNLGWKNPGYHHLVEPSGKINDLQPIEKLANGVKGYNSNSIHLSYIGGKEEDDRTEQQKEALKRLVKHYKREYPRAEVLGHRDFEGVSKSCPRFNVKEWLKEVGINE